ncbi:MAG: DUF3825 domain-containing protein [Bifidobacteriaceae bacterium]|nr:DUF3825 domain-containing protein [Bifidobacteriaceae bacterium]
MLFRDYANVPNDRWGELADLAQPEQWESEPASPGRPFRVLRNYVSNTFRRAESQGRVAGTEYDGQQMTAFNTGLVTPHYEAIYALFTPNQRSEAAPRFLRSFCAESDSRLMPFHRLPQRATYFDNPADLLYDTRLELRVQVDHIVNVNGERFPASLHEDARRRAESLRRAIDHAKFRVEQNYKTAIPQFYWPPPGDDGRLQLLLPLCLQDLSRADLALSIDKVGEVYRAATVLTLGMAYNNARLIARPDREWLVPTGSDDAY